MKLTSIRKWEQLKIYINGSLHLYLKLQDLISIQSWVHSSCEYYIEYTFVSGTKLTSGYTSIEKWKEVLKILDENITVIG